MKKTILNIIGQASFFKIFLLIVVFIGVKSNSVAQCNAGFSSYSDIYSCDKKIVFTNHNKGTVGINYLWDFGDSTTSNIKNPIHEFKHFKDYNVCLVLTDTINKCRDSICNLIYIYPLDFNFRVYGKKIEGYSTRYMNDFWDFGDGNRVRNEYMVFHTYDTQGVYNFCRIKYCSKTDSVKTCYKIDNRCKAAFKYKVDSIYPLKVVFTNASTGYGPATYSWHFGVNENDSKDSITQKKMNPTFKFPKPGYYNVGLLRQEDNSTYCHDSIGETIIIGKPPCDTSVYFRIYSNYLNRLYYSMKFNHQNFKIDFGDGTFSNENSGNHDYKKGGTYLLSLSYVCYTGKNIKLYRKIYIPPKDSCLQIGLLIDYQSNITCYDSFAYAKVHGINGQAPYTYIWGTEPQIKDSIARFSKSGTYYVTMTDANKCRRSKAILVNDQNLKNSVDIDANIVFARIRPGSFGVIKVQVTNNGCIKSSGKVFLVMSKLLTYLSANPKPDKQVRDTIFWNYSDLINDNKKFEAEVSYMTVTSANTKDTVNLTISASIDTLETYTTNNFKNYKLNIRNSYDPNVKSVYPYGECYERYVEKLKPLTYTVQFQNTGSAEAINIAIDDVTSEFYDIKTLRVIMQSHPNLVLEVIDSNKVRFVFNNINLPDSFMDEKGSHGFITYEIYPKSSLISQTKVGGNAKIYFDYNAPISTNTVMNTLIDKIPNCYKAGALTGDFKNARLHYYPNPTNHILNLEIYNKVEFKNEISIINFLGETVYYNVFELNSLTLEIGFLPSGIYLLKVRSGDEIMSGKFIKY